MNILISTIIRNRATFLHNYINQLNELVEIDSSNNFFISIYENDSVDGSQEILKNLDYSKFKDVFIKSEIKNTPYFGSIKHNERVQILAEARNKSIYQNDFLNVCDWVLSVEPDIFYEPKKLYKIIENNHYDILSARSIEIYPPPKNHIYDGWGTRNTENHFDWEPNVIFDDIHETWTTYNCFCKYRAKPIIEGVCFDGFNKRLNIHDCDTAVICENFREKGYNKIALVGDCLALHKR
jgi:Cryptococcal mannosyltransferase 1